MKNQYFGDVNDYKKYGLLRVLADSGHNKIAVCWMLTENDAGGDGELRSYLRDQYRWMYHDRALFETLSSLLNPGSERSVSLAKKGELIPGAIYYPPVLNNDAGQRAAYFEEFLQRANDCHLVFLDPDNGLEIKSVSKGWKDSCKYIYWDELASIYSAGFSVLIYQHFPRVSRVPFIHSTASQMIQNTGARQIFVFSTSHVAFFLILQPKHEQRFSPLVQEVSKRWGSQIEVVTHPPQPVLD